MNAEETVASRCRAVDGLHVVAVDVMEYFVTVGRGILVCVLAILGMAGWFHVVLFAYHAEVWLRFKLAVVL